jgi:hypothetical protein
MQQTLIATSMEIYFATSTQTHYAKIIAQDQQYAIREIPQEEAGWLNRNVDLGITEIDELHPTEANIPIVLSDNARTALLNTILHSTKEKYWGRLDKEAIDIINSVAKPGKETTLAAAIFAALKAGKTIPIHNARSPYQKWTVLSMDAIHVGEQMLIDECMEHFKDMIYTQTESHLAEVWFQYICMPNFIY